jgi:hypothetical protein
MIKLMQISTVLLAILLVIGCVVITHDNYHEAKLREFCHQHGGVWLHSDRVCFKADVIFIQGPQ